MLTWAFVYSLGIGSLHGNSIENFVIKLLYWCLLTTICSAHVNRVLLQYNYFVKLTLSTENHQIHYVCSYVKTLHYG